MCAED
jgi:predicted transcriptional regulator of viral defense system